MLSSFLCNHYHYLTLLCYTLLLKRAACLEHMDSEECQFNVNITHANSRVVAVNTFTFFFGVPQFNVTLTFFITLNILHTYIGTFLKLCDIT